MQPRTLGRGEIARARPDTARARSQR